MPQPPARPLRVAFLLGSLHRGGTESLALAVFCHAREAPFHLVGLHRKDGALRPAFMASGPLFQKLGPRFPWDPRYLRRLRRWLQKQKVEVVHAQQIRDARYARCALRGTGVKVVLTLHGYYQGRSARKDRALRRLMGSLDKTVFVSASQRDTYFQALGLDAETWLPRTAVVYNGISLDKRPLAAPSGAARLQLGTVGNFNSVRDPYTLCRFLKRLRDQGLPFDFYFVGRREPHEPLHYDRCVAYCAARGLGDCVHFLGSRAPVSALLAAWDAFLYSTDHDSFGLAVVEALAVGLPVFVNDTAVMREITRQGRWAYLYKSRDPAHLLQVFQAFLRDRPAAQARAREASAAVRHHYSLDRHLRALGELYRQL